MTRKIIKCKNCGELKPHKAKGLCSACYNKQNLIKCKSCGKLKPHASKGLCNACYKKQNLKICSECGKLKPHIGKGLCAACYRKQNLIICSSCRELKPYSIKGLCITCYTHKTGKNLPMSENKFCSAYLGIMAEELLSKVFKDVKQMPYGNKGFDFKCNKGKKIDVKSSVLYFDKRQLNPKGYWSFIIRKNKIPDYFLCIAFDNRTSLIPQHLWLIPSEKINHLTTLIISKNQTHKWSEYEMNLDTTLKCCNLIKIKKNKLNKLIYNKR